MTFSLPPSLSLRRLLWLTLACALPLASPTQAQAQETSELEKRVKAAYVLKFADYVDWPAAAFDHEGAPITFGVLGDEQVADELAQSAAGRMVGGHPLAVRRVKEGDGFADLRVIFVAGKDPARLAHVIKSTGAQPLLIVTETEGALQRGSAINFVLADGRVKFEIGLDGVEKHGLRLSSRLLTVAQHVYPTAVSQ